MNIKNINSLAIFLVSLASLLSGVACAKSDGSPLIGGKHDSKTPIDVTSDSLDVLQEKNQAIFIGHVVAIQGDVRIKSDKMTVYYAKPPSDKANSKAGSKPAEKPVDNKKDSAANGDVEKNSIKKIDVDGDVFLITADETASGKSGTYDVEHQMLYLNDNVVLTRGKNVLKGDKLTYNMATGKSNLVANGGASADGKGKQRVHALFVPEDKDK